MLNSGLPPYGKNAIKLLRSMEHGVYCGLADVILECVLEQSNDFVQERIVNVDHFWQQQTTLDALMRAWKVAVERAMGFVEHEIRISDSILVTFGVYTAAQVYPIYFLYKGELVRTLGQDPHHIVHANVGDVLANDSSTLKRPRPVGVVAMMALQGINNRTIWLTDLHTQISRRIDRGSSRELAAVVLERVDLISVLEAFR